MSNIDRAKLRHIESNNRRLESEHRGNSSEYQSLSLARRDLLNRLRHFGVPSVESVDTLSAETRSKIPGLKSICQDIRQITEEMRAINERNRVLEPRMAQARQLCDACRTYALRQGVR